MEITTESIHINVDAQTMNGVYGSTGGLDTPDRRCSSLWKFLGVNSHIRDVTRTGGKRGLCRAGAGTFFIEPAPGLEYGYDDARHGSRH